MKLTVHSGATLAVAAAALLAGTVAPQPAAASHKVACYGINACKGHGACKTASNACKGQNSCKGTGFLEMTAKECTAAKAKAK